MAAPRLRPAPHGFRWIAGQIAVLQPAAADRSPDHTSRTEVDLIGIPLLMDCLQIVFSLLS